MTPCLRGEFPTAADFCDAHTPEKMHDPVALNALYYLMDCDTVTPASVLAPHRELTLRKMAAQAGKVLVLHDTTELDFSGHKSRRGWLCHHALVVSPQTREVLGLVGQILQARAMVRKNESVANKRERVDRASRLWRAGTQGFRKGYHEVFPKVLPPLPHNMSTVKATSIAGERGSEKCWPPCTRDP